MRWYEQAGTPEISFDEVFDAGAQTYTLTLRQTYSSRRRGRSEKKPFLIPVALGLLDAIREGDPRQDGDSRSAGTRNSCLRLLPSRRFRRLFRNFSAPIKLVGQSRERLQFLSAHDSDLFNRWDCAAAIRVAGAAGCHRQLSERREAFANSMPGCGKRSPAFCRKPKTDPAFAAEALDTAG